MRIIIEADSLHGEEIVNYFKKLFLEQPNIPVQIGALKLDCHFGPSFDEQTKHQVGSHVHSVISFTLTNSCWELPL